MSSHLRGPAADERAAGSMRPLRSSIAKRGLVGLAALLACLAFPAGALAFNLASLKTVTPIGSTVPGNGDVNPYGIANVTQSVGALVRGDVLISNFNDEGNLQGTGTTLVQVSPAGGSPSVFAQINPHTLPGPCPGGVGLTTALTILPNGYVVVGSLPTENGKAETASAGCLIVLNPNGQVVKTISSKLINGPWDMTAASFFGGRFTMLFVTNVLNGTVASKETPTNGGTVVRLVLNNAGGTPVVSSEQVIATGFPERTDPNALVVGPTGLAVGRGGWALYVADTQGNRIAFVPEPLFRQTPFGGGGITAAAGGKLNSPLGLTVTPNGNILTANAGDGNIVETAPFGPQLAAVDTGAGGGGLFGLTLTPEANGVYFVNDTENALDLLH